MEKDGVLDAVRGLVSMEEYGSRLASVGELLGRRADCGEVIVRLGNGVAALDSATTALYAFLRYGGDYLETVKFCTSLGGDTDTISAMAGAISGAHLGERGLPGEFLVRLEGREAIGRLASRLFRAATAQG